MYVARHNRKKAKRFGLEMKIVEELRNRLTAGDGFARIRMKDDNTEIDICQGVDEKFHLSFPPYYGDRDYGMDAPVYRPLDRWFNGLDEVAEFLLSGGWKRVWG